MRPVVGVIGGGQLARMMIPPAIELGIDIRVLAETEGSPAAIAATAVGDYTDVDTVLAFAQQVDVVTFDHEHVPQNVLAELIERGINVQPQPAALAVAQDKIVMRQRLEALALPIPDWAPIATPEELDTFLSDHQGRGVVKTARGGYDGKGVRVVRQAADVADWFGPDTGALLVEELVPFRRELAQSVARRPSGDIVAWPLVESIQRGGVCAEVIAPAPSSAGLLADMAADIAHTIAAEIGVTGVLAVELFETNDERLLINELAMRPHNTGHWSIDGSTTSQFEQHLRAVLDLPLGATGCHADWSVMVNVLGGAPDGLTGRYPQTLADQPTVKVHDYGKASRAGRKVGHVTAIGDELDEVVWQARTAASLLGGELPEGAV